jgi:putative endonuclease
VDVPFNTRRDGADHEELALAFLAEKGYRLVERNFHLGRAGEIDLVMRDGAVLVFIEVKARRTHLYGLPEEAVTPAKRRQIRRVAEGYVQVRGITDYQARFDVIAIDYATGVDEQHPEIRHFVDAF